MATAAPSKHRFVTIGGKLYRMTNENRRRALKEAASMNATDIELDLGEFRIVKVSDFRVEDWTDMTSAMAEALLAGTPPETAEEVAATQEAIEQDAPLIEVTAENRPIQGRGRIPNEEEQEAGRRSAQRMADKARSI